jgi:hypothetical protein
MEQLKMILVKMDDDCISWTPKSADFFLGTKFFENNKNRFIFGKKTLENGNITYIKNLYMNRPDSCLVYSKENNFSKIISQLDLNYIYWVLGGKRLFTLFERIISELICVHIHIPSVKTENEIFYNFPADQFELSKIASKHLDFYKTRVNYDICYYKNKNSSNNGFVSQESKYINLSKYFLSSNNNTFFTANLFFDMTIDNFPILTVRKMDKKKIFTIGNELYENYKSEVKENDDMYQDYICQDLGHTIQFNIDGNNLSILVYIPSCNYFYELSEYISIYALFLILCCRNKSLKQPKMLNFIVGKLTCSGSEEEKYFISEQIKRCTLPFPILLIRERENNKRDFYLDDYYSWPEIYIENEK